MAAFFLLAVVLLSRMRGADIAALGAEKNGRRGIGVEVA